MIDDADGDDPREKSSMDLSPMKAMREEEFASSRAIPGHSLHEVYSNQMLPLAVDRNSVECMMKQLKHTNVCEIFSPECVAAVCWEYGVTPGAAMYTQSGFDFDIAADRKRRGRV